MLAGHELWDRRPASVPGFALQLQKQLAAKLQESRVRCRESAKLGLESLRTTELREGAVAVDTLGVSGERLLLSGFLGPFGSLRGGDPAFGPQRGEGFMLQRLPASAQRAASTAACSLVEKLRQREPYETCREPRRLWTGARRVARHPRRRGRRLGGAPSCRGRLLSQKELY